MENVVVANIRVQSLFITPYAQAIVIVQMRPLPLFCDHTQFGAMFWLNRVNEETLYRQSVRYAATVKKKWELFATQIVQIKCKILCHAIFLGSLSRAWVLYTPRNCLPENISYAVYKSNQHNVYKCFHPKTN